MIYNIDDVMTFAVTTSNPSTGAGADVDSAGVPAYRVYEDETTTAILTGNMAKLDDTNTIGLYSEQLTLSAANGFEIGKSYTIYITATVGAVAGTKVLQFSVALLKVNTTQLNSSGTSLANLHTAFVSTSVPAVNTTKWNGVDISGGAIVNANVGQISGDATAADNAEAFFDGTGYAGTNNVMPTVTTLNGLAANSVNASALATDAVQEIRNAITGGAYALDTDANGRVRIVDGTGVGELDTSSGTVPLRSATQASIDAIQTALGTAGAGLTAVPWNIAWDAEVQSEVQDAIEANNLDHLLKIAVDTDFATTVHLNSALGHLADNGTAASFDRTTDSLEAIRDRGDAAWTTGGAGSISDIVSVQPLIPTSIDLANTATYRLGLMLFNALDDLPSTAEITPGTISIDRKAIGGTSWTAILTDQACSEAAGLVYFDEVFDTGTGYAEGDSLRITFKSQKVTVAANDYEITDSTGRIFYTEIRQTERGTNNASTLDGAGVRTALGMAAANLDVQLSAIDDFLDTEIAAIKAVVDSILVDTGTGIPGTLSSISTTLGAVLVDTAEIGVAGAGLTNINLPNQTMDIIGNITGNLSGSVGSVFGNVGGNIAGSVGSLATQAKADVNAEAALALADIHLNRLFAVDYDPANKPGVATALFNELIESDAGVSRYTANALEQAPSGGGGGGAAGSGGTAVTLTIHEPGGADPAAGARVWLTTDAAGTVVVAGTLPTDDFGEVTFMLDAGTYYVWSRHPLFNDILSQTLVVP